jgi:hypothetical protein
MATVSLQGEQRDIVAHQGSSIRIDFALTNQASLPLDMSGYTLRLQVRKSYADTSTLINATLANGKLVWIAQASGTFYLLLGPTDTNTLRFPTDNPGSLEAVYDLEIESPTGFVTKPCHGLFTLTREVTR